MVKRGARVQRAGVGFSPRFEFITPAHVTARDRGAASAPGKIGCPPVVNELSVENSTRPSEPRRYPRSRAFWFNDLRVAQRLQ
jgi:hypothetical protein